MYTVEVTYHTGDSFNSYTEKDTIEFKWESKDLARQAMNEIYEHHIFAEDYYRLGESEREEYKLKPWFTGHKYYQFTLQLELDSGKRQRITVPWNGYFERIEELHVISVEDERDFIIR